MILARKLLAETLAAGGGWDLSTASYDGVSLSIGSEDTIPYDIAFKPDGTKMFVVGNANDSVYQYGLSTAFDLNTASYDGSFSVSSEDTGPISIAFSPDGVKMYMVGYANDAVYQYSLVTAWDISGGVFYDTELSIGSEDTIPYSIAFKPDGTKMFVVGNANDAVYQYGLSTAFDLNTASYDNVSFSVSSEDTGSSGIAFKPDGTKMFVVGNANDAVYQYGLSTAFDLNTASYDNVSFNTSSQDTGSVGVAFKPDGTKMYVIGYANDSVYQYSLS